MILWPEMAACHSKSDSRVTEERQETLVSSDFFLDAVSRVCLKSGYVADSANHPKTTDTHDLGCCGNQLHFSVERSCVPH
jgi:hypothetical protein